MNTPDDLFKRPADRVVAEKLLSSAVSAMRATTEFFCNRYLDGRLDGPAAALIVTCAFHVASRHLIPEQKKQCSGTEAADGMMALMNAVMDQGMEAARNAK